MLFVGFKVNLRCITQPLKLRPLKLFNAGNDWGDRVLVGPLAAFSVSRIISRVLKCLIVFVLLIWG